MDEAESLSERPILWSHMLEAVKFWHEKPSHDQMGTETTCVVTMHRGVDVKAIRNWLAEEFDADFELLGIFKTNKLVAVRFNFKTFDDKLLFALRWL